jgi:hypothetical protein
VEEAAEDTVAAAADEAVAAAGVDKISSVRKHK